VVQIDFARRALQVHLLLAGQTGTEGALRRLHEALGDREPLREAALGSGRVLTTTLRPERFPFLAPRTPEHPRPKVRSRIEGLTLEVVLWVLRGAIREDETGGVPNPDGVLEVTDWAEERGWEPERRDAARAALDATLARRGIDPAQIPRVRYVLEGALPPPCVLSRRGPPGFRDSGSEARGLLRAFSALGGIILAKLDQHYCGCMFSPERLSRFSDLVLEADLASGVTQAVLAGESRPREPAH
jgi:hypothetical protein